MVYETVDTVILKSLIAKKEFYSAQVRNDEEDKDLSSQFTLLEKYLQKVDRDKVEVEYYQKTPQGRYFARGSLSLQSFKREIRHTLASNTYVDLDMVNCHPTIIYKYFLKQGITLNALKTFIDNRDIVLNELLDCNPDLNLGGLKTMVLKTIYGGMPQVNPTDWFRRFYSEIGDILKLVPTYFEESFSLCKSRDPNYWNLNGKAFALGIQVIENELLSEFVDYLKENKYIDDTYVKVFDGIMIPKKTFSPKILDEFKSISQYSVRWVVKDMTPLKICKCPLGHNDIERIFKNGKKKCEDTSDIQFFTSLIKSFNTDCERELTRSLKQVFDVDEIPEYPYDSTKDLQWSLSVISGTKIQDRNLKIKIKNYLSEEKNIIIRGDIEQLIDLKDPYNFIDFRKAVRTKIFKDYHALIDYCAEFLPRVLFIVDKPRCFLVKRNNKIEITPPKSLTLMYLYYMKKSQDNSHEASITLSKFIEEPFTHKLFSPLDSIIFNPNLENDYNSCYNTFGGFKGDTNSYASLTAVEMDRIKPILYHLRDVWCCGDETVYTHFLCWFATIVKYPDVKTKIVPVLYSKKQQVGKNILTDFFSEYVFGREYAKSRDLREVLSDFNSDMETALFVVIDEVSSKSSNNSFHSSFDKMKNLITNSKKTIQPKYMDRYEIDDYTQYIITTNNIASIKIEGAGDARYFPVEVSEKHHKDFEYFTKLTKSFDDKSGEIMFRYLRNYEITRDLRNIPNTKLREQMIELNDNSVNSFQKQLIEFCKGSMDIHDEVWLSDVKDHVLVVKNQVRIKKSDLYDIFISYCASVGETKFKKKYFNAGLSFEEIKYVGIRYYIIV